MLDSSSPFAGAEPPGPDAKNLLALRRLRHAAVSCEIRPGAHVTEAEIAARFGLGRAGVRTALNTLSAENFAAPRPRKGWQIAPVTGALIGEIIDGRRRLEPALADKGLTANMAEQLLSLARINVGIAERHDAQPLVTARLADRQIMQMLAERNGRFLRHWLAQVWDHADRIVHFLAAEGTRYRPIDRGPLIGALASGELDTARAELERDICRYLDFVTDALLRLPLALSVIPKQGRKTPGGDAATSERVADGHRVRRRRAAGADGGEPVSRDLDLRRR